MSENKGLSLMDLLVGAGIVYAAYTLIGGGNKDITTREQAISVIMSFNPNANLSTLQTADIGYVIARAKAYQAALPIYTYNGRQYLTSSGTAA